MALVLKYASHSLIQSGLWLSLLLLTVTIIDTHGQDAVTQIRESGLEKVYGQFTPRNILSGKTYAPDYSQIGGDQFFFDYYESEGYFIYDGIRYDNLPYQYDIYSQAIIVKTIDQNGTLITISIDADKVSRFQSGDVTFVNNKSEMLPGGFYQIAYHGIKSRLMIGRSKEVKKLSQNVRGKLRIFVPKNRYFLTLDESAVEIKSKKDLFKVFEDNESLINHAKKMRIAFKKEGLEGKLISILTYYEGL